MLDSTVKSGLKFLAPAWEMVLNHKAGIITDSEYVARYIPMMEDSLIRFPKAWDKLLAMDEVAIACYCKAGAFCHRCLLVEIIRVLCNDRGISFVYMGELKKDALKDENSHENKD